MEEQMKESDIAWIWEIPKEWAVNKIRFVTELRSEKGWYTPHDKYIGLENISSHTGKFLPSDSEYESGYYDMYYKGDVLFSTLRPYLAKTLIATDSGFCTGEFIIIKKYAGDVRYLFYYLLSDGFLKMVDASTYGAKMPRASWDYIKNLQIPIIPEISQRNIADFLNKQCSLIDSIAADITKQIEILREYKVAVITEAVTKGLDKSVPMKDSGIAWIWEIPRHWNVSKVKYLFNIVNGSTPESSSQEYWDGEIRWITPADMQSTGSLNSGSKNITESGYQSCSTELLPCGSIVISSRAPIGKINITTEILCTNQGCKGLVRSMSSNKYSYYYFIAGQKELIRLGKGTTFSELSTQSLGQFPILTLPIREHETIAQYLDEKCSKIDSIIDDKQSQLEIIQTYKNSLIYEYVTGKKQVNEEITA